MSDFFDERDKASHRERQIDTDCDKAYKIGQNIVTRNSRLKVFALCLVCMEVLV